MTETELLLELVNQNAEQVGTIANHVQVMNQEMGMVQQDVAVLKTQMADLIWLTRAIGVGVLGVVIERGAKIYINWKGNKK
jgi:hypothetical protein